MLNTPYFSLLWSDSSLPHLNTSTSLPIYDEMNFSTMFVIRILPYFLLTTTASATWSVSVWDGLACGDLPQVAKQFVWDHEAKVIEGYATLDPGPKAYSMIAETDTDDVEVSLPGRREARKRVEAACTNPDISFPYFASYKVILRDNKK